MRDVLAGHFKGVRGEKSEDSKKVREREDSDLSINGGVRGQNDVDFGRGENLGGDASL